MGLITVDQARAHARLDEGYPVDQLQAAIDGASDSVMAYLNRTVYESDIALQAARSQYVAVTGAASSERKAAMAAAATLPTVEERRAAERLAESVYSERMRAADRCLDGLVINSSIRSAVLLIFGHLFSNRESVVVGQSVAELPLGATELLRPYRIVQMP
ncbi:hypothetical protein DM611_08705 [Stenotrophomonas maltophilia]|nr:hypothetical protein DM611_08705 [Stenotrophomonas maltophilia]